MSDAGERQAASGSRSRAAVLFTRLGVATLPSVILNRMLGRDVVVFNDSPLAWINRLAAFADARSLDFSTLPALDVRDVYGDLHGAGTRTAAYYSRSDFVRRAAALFPGIERPEPKIDILVRTFVDARCSAAAFVSTWARCAINRYAQAIVTGPLDRISVVYLAMACPEIRLGPCVPLYQALDTVWKVMSRMASRVHKSAVGARGVTRRERKMLPGFVPGSDSIDSPVLYFPHKTISYGGLFLKDQFYSRDPGSPFHPSRIMHVELEPIAESWCVGELADVYEDLGIRYCLLDTHGDTGLIAALYRYLRRLFELKAIGYALRSPRLAYIVFRQWRRFETYRRALERFPMARIALVGHEMLFPVTLSLALESRGIRTMATQERLLASTCYRNWNYILDTYLVASTRVAERISADPGKYVGNLVPVGLVRSDLVRQYENEAAGGRPAGRSMENASPKVIVFDFHSVRDERTNARTLVNNWRSNRAFYEEILRLAKAFPGVLFTIRSKNPDWQTMAEFADIVDAMQRQPNIETGRETGQMHDSYRLAAASDVVIAKHTSIAEECMAAGMPTIIHDHLPNAERTVSLCWDYDGIAVFVNSYEELAERLARTLERGHYLDAVTVARLQEVVNDRAADGKVLSRIARELERLWRETAGGDDCGFKTHLAV